MNKNKNGKKIGLKLKGKSDGFTLIEILVVLGILAVLATLVLVAVNPSRQFKMARDTKRAANVATILNAVSQNLLDNNGALLCNGVAVSIPTDPVLIESTETGVDLASCLVPDYIAGLPYDPSFPGANYVNESDYATHYFISADSFGRVTVSAEGEMLGHESITATR